MVYVIYLIRCQFYIFDILIYQLVLIYLLLVSHQIVLNYAFLSKAFTGDRQNIWDL